MANNVKIKFNFIWKGVDYENLDNSILDAAYKLVDENKIKVDTNLNSQGEIVIRFCGFCHQEKQNNDDNFDDFVNLNPSISLKNICVKGNNTKRSCEHNACPVLAAGYIYYLKNREKPSLEDELKLIDAEFAKEIQKIKSNNNISNINTSNKQNDDNINNSKDVNNNKDTNNVNSNNKPLAKETNPKNNDISSQIEYNDELNNLDLNNTNKPFDINKKFGNLIGLANVKKQISEIHSFLRFRQDLLNEGINFPNVDMHMSFVGNKGNGKTSVAKIVADLLYNFGYLRSNNLVEISAKDLLTSFSSEAEKVINQASNGVLLINDVEALIPNKQKQLDSSEKAQYVLLKKMKVAKDIVIIFSDNDKNLTDLFNSCPELQQKVNHAIIFDDYTVDELIKLFKSKISKIDFKIDNDFEQSLKKLFTQASELQDFNNELFVDKTFQNVLINHSLINDNQNKFLLTKDSLPSLNELLIHISEQHVERNPNVIEDLFKYIIGMDEIKSQFLDVASYIKFRNQLSEKSSEDLPEGRLHMVFTGNSGTGKTIMARKLTEMLYHLGCIKINKLVEVGHKDLIGEYVGQTAPKTQKVIESAIGGVLFVDEAYSLVKGYQGYGNEAIVTLITAMENYKDNLVVIFAGYKKEMTEFIDSNPGISSRIGYTFNFKDYSCDELYKIFELNVKKYNLTIVPKVKNKIMEIFKFYSSIKNFGNGRFVDKLFQEILINHSKNPALQENLTTILLEDIPSIEEMSNQSLIERNPAKIDDLFNDIIGMKEIKSQLLDISSYIKFRNKLSEQTDSNLPENRLHMVFTGNPGTGKTLMARKITEMLYHLGCIKMNKLVEVERKDLVAEYIGQTAPKTAEVIEKAIGGVLFIDEAYSLTYSDSAKDFGQEAISTLITAMENNKDNLVVIFAGYKKEMQHFINSNPGIASRVGYTFNFKDYTNSELYKIFELNVKKHNLNIAPNVKEKVVELFKFFGSVKNFGNGRFVDKVFQEILINHSKNSALNENLNTILPEDIPTIQEMIEITFNDNENFVIPTDLDTEEKKCVAIHELGHAIASYILYNGKSDLKEITIVPEGGGTMGYVLHNKSNSKDIYTKDYFIKQIKILLAGRAAEEIFYGVTNVSTGCSNDLKHATEILNVMFKNYGLSESLGLMTIDSNLSPQMLENLEQEKKSVLNDSYLKVKDMLQKNKTMFDICLDTLLTKGTLTGEEFTKLLKTKI